MRVAPATFRAESAKDFFFLEIHLSSLNRPPASRNESKVEQELYFIHGQPRGQRSPLKFRHHVKTPTNIILIGGSNCGKRPDKEEEEDREKEETMQGFEDELGWKVEDLKENS